MGLVASFHGILIAASRAMLELGRVGYLPKPLGVVSARTHTPVAALIANMALGALVLVTGKTADIIVLAVLGALTLYALSSAAVLQLRRSEPALDRPYRTPFYPVAPIVALALSLVCMVAVAARWPWLALIYAAILAASVLAFVLLVPPAKRVSFRT